MLYKTSVTQPVLKAITVLNRTIKSERRIKGHAGERKNNSKERLRRNY